MSNYKILFKYASRSRNEKFFDGLDNILNNLNDLNNFCILCSLDADDETMNNQQSIKRITEYVKKYPANIVVKFGKSKNKIDAINRDVNDFKERFDFDILDEKTD